MGRRIDTLEVPAGDDGDAVTITSEALSFEASEDLLPEVMQIAGAAFDRIAPLIAAGKVTGDDDIMALAPALGAIATQIGGGRLQRLAPKVLAGTSVVGNFTGERLKFDLVKKEDRTIVFEARPDLYFKCILHAGRLTFGRFFPGIGRGAKGKASPKGTSG